MAEVDFTIEELDDMTRKDLQALAKRHGIKANLKSATIIEQLTEYYNKHCAEQKENRAPDNEAVQEPEPEEPEVEQVEVEVEEQRPQQTVESVEVEEDTVKPTEEPSTVEPMEEEEEEVPQQPIATPQKVQRTLPKNPVPPSPLQKFARNASAALTPRKTPLRPAQTTQTPAKEMYIITPRKNKNKKNLFSTPRKPEVTAIEVEQPEEEPEVDVFATVQVKSTPVPPSDLFRVLGNLCDSEPYLADYISATFVARALADLTQSIVRQAMKEEGVKDLGAFVLKRESFEKALTSVLTGDLAANAVAESGRIRERYGILKDEEWDSRLLGLFVNHASVHNYLTQLGVNVQSVEDVLALSACLEYISSEIWELSDKKECESFSLVQLDAVIEALKSDEELNFTFKKLLEHETAPKSEPAVVQRLQALLPDNGTGASQTEILELEKSLRFSLPVELRTFLSLRNGESLLGVDSAKNIKGSAEVYQEVSIVYSLLNWVPIRSHGDGDVWDCYDVKSGFVLRAGLLPKDEEEFIFPSEYPVVAKSFEEYIERHLAKNDSNILEVAGAPVLKDVDEELAQVAKFWINITEEEFEDEEEEL